MNPFYPQQQANLSKKVLKAAFYSTCTSKIALVSSSASDLSPDHLTDTNRICQPQRGVSAASISSDSAVDPDTTLLNGDKIHYPDWF